MVRQQVEIYEVYIIKLSKFASVFSAWLKDKDV